MIILKNVSPTTAVTSVPVCGAVFVFKPFGCNFDFFVFSHSILCGTVFVSKLFGWEKNSRKCSSSLWLLEPKKIFFFCQSFQNLPHSWGLLFYQSFQNLPRFWNLYYFSKVLEPATFLGTCNFFQSSRNLPRF